MVKSRGGKLAAGFAVNMPYNYIFPSFVLKGFFHSFVLRKTSKEKQQNMLDHWKQKLEIICEYVQAWKEGELETKADFIEHLVDSLLRDTLQKSVWLKVAGFKGHTNLPFQESIQLMDHGFKCDDKCNRCGICSKICPVKILIWWMVYRYSNIIVNNVLLACNGAQKRRSSSVTEHHEVKDIIILT